MLDPIFNLLAGLLEWFYSLVPSYGFAIIALTTLVLIILSPLTFQPTSRPTRVVLLVGTELWVRHHCADHAGPDHFVAPDLSQHQIDGVDASIAAPS